MIAVVVPAGVSTGASLIGGLCCVPIAGGVEGAGDLAFAHA
jgi:hypothetical protein